MVGHTRSSAHDDMVFVIGSAQVVALLWCGMWLKVQRDARIRKLCAAKAEVKLLFTAVKCAERKHGSLVHLALNEARARLECWRMW